MKIHLFTFCLVCIMFSAISCSGTSDSTALINIDESDQMILESVSIDQGSIRVPHKVAEKFVEHLNSSKVSYVDVSDVAEASEPYCEISFSDQQLLIMGGTSVDFVEQKIDGKIKIYTNEAFKKFHDLVFIVLENDDRFEGKEAKQIVTQYLAE